MSSSKPILIVDDSEDSLIANELFSRKKVEYVRYHVSNLKPIVVAQQATVLEVPVCLFQKECSRD
ncbi:MAG TPA: hypothetical protein VE544_10855 [Nitrososphaeraceae archaeon]|nr:hypothetical protein [Nitrososphaeraceae archaeon]